MISFNAGKTIESKSVTIPEIVAFGNPTLGIDKGGAAMPLKPILAHHFLARRGDNLGAFEYDTHDGFPIAWQPLQGSDTVIENVDGKSLTISGTLPMVKSEKMFLSGASLKTAYSADQTGFGVATRNALRADIENSYNSENPLSAKVRWLDFENRSWSQPAGMAELLGIGINMIAEAINLKLRITQDAIQVLNGNTIVIAEPLTYKVVLTGASAGTLSGANVVGNVATSQNVPYSTPVIYTPPVGGNATNAMLTFTDNFYNTTYGVNVVLGEKVNVVSDEVTMLEAVMNNGFELDTKDDFANGIGDITYSINSGEIPDGMNFLNGVLTGSPIQEGEFVFTIASKDTGGFVALKTYSLTVQALPNFDFTPPHAIVGKPYNYTPDIPLTAIVEFSNPLPNGLTWDNEARCITGTPTAPSNASNVVAIKSNDTAKEESTAFTLRVYNPVTVTSAGQNLLGGILSPKKGQNIPVVVAGGSGKYTFSSSNLRFSNNRLYFVSSGEAQFTVLDEETNLQTTYSFRVDGQDEVQPFVVQPVANDTQRPINVTRPLYVQTGSSVEIGFSAMSFENFITGQILTTSVNRNAGTETQLNESPFALIEFKGQGSFVELDLPEHFLSKVVISQAMFNSTANIRFGLADKNAAPFVEAVLTTIETTRYIEIRYRDNYVAGTRRAIMAGEVFRWGYINGNFALWLNNLLVGQVTVTRRATAIIRSESLSPLSIGGRIMGLTYSIITEGDATQVGQVDTQTGRYTPAPENVAVVTIQAVGLNNTIYQATVRVLIEPIFARFRKARRQNVPMKIFLTHRVRKNRMPLALVNGKPDANQFSDIAYMGILKSSGKLDMQATSNESKDDVGVYAYNTVVDKYDVSGDLLEIADFNLLQKLIPHMKVMEVEGVTFLRQASTGCLKEYRAILVWETASDCGNYKTYDAVEFPKVFSSTPFSFEVGSSAVSSIPLKLMAVKDDDENYLMDFYCFNEEGGRIA